MSRRPPANVSAKPVQPVRRDAGHLKSRIGLRRHRALSDRNRSLQLCGVTETLPAAVLWDMDGTLVDTEPSWLAAEAALVESVGGTWHHADSVQLIGQGLGITARFMQSRGVDLPEREIIERLTAIVLQQIEREIPWRPGARELLAELREAGVPTALVTMSIRPLAERMVSGMGFH